MNKSDGLGRIFGFMRRENCNCWHWFSLYLDIAKDYLSNSENLPVKLSSPNSRSLFPHNENPKCPTWELVEHRERVIIKYIHANKFNFKKLYNELRRMTRDSIFNALHMLQIDKCELNLTSSIEESQLAQFYGDSDNLGDDDDDDDTSFFNDSEHFYYSFLPFHPRNRAYLVRKSNDTQIWERMRYGVKSDTFKKLGLPTFRPLYMYFIDTVLGIVYLCNRVHLDSNKDVRIMSKFKANLVCIEVLVQTSRELIEESIVFRQFGHHFVSCLEQKKKSHSI